MALNKKRIRVEKKTGTCICGKAISRRAKACATHRDMQKAKNNAWKGDDVGYHGLHRWVVKMKGKPSLCEKCGTTKAKKFEWANKSGLYKRDVNDWIRMCTKCHHDYDDIIRRGWKTRKNIC